MDADARRTIRRDMRAARRALPPWQQRLHARDLARRLIGSALFRRSRHIALFIAADGEPDLAPLIAQAWAMGKCLYLPVLTPERRNRLWFAPYRRGEPLRLNRFRIPEPRANWSQMRRPWAIDLILTPLVAFDAQGHRLGMGGGFYDRTLAYLSQRRHWRKPALLGVAHALQQHPALPHAAWDIPLHGVVTERELLLSTTRGDKD